MKYLYKHKNYLKILLIGVLGFLLVQCNKEPDEVEIPDELKQIMQYIADDSVSYSEFYELALETNLSGILSTRGPFTLFLPDNEAFKAYYKEKGKNSYLDFTKEELSDLMRNHIISAQISTSDMGLGSLSEKNALGDYLVSELPGTEIVINKRSYITDRDIIVANGIVHRIDNVIDPVTKGIFTTIKELEEYSIFSEALKIAGLSDTLDIVQIPYGQGIARVRYTILAVPDSVFNANGIFNVNDLIDKYNNQVGELDETDNGFHDYMEYHCLENTFYMSNIEDGLYYIISRNNYIYFEVGSEFSINSSETDSIYTTLIEKYSNIPSKNGVIHGINQLLPPQNPEPMEYQFDTTTFPEFQELEGYAESGTVRNFYDGENGFANIKWTGDYLQYWCKAQGTGFINEDCLVMSEGYWTLEVTLPRIARGHYEVTGYFKKGGNRANIVFYIDGVKIDKVIELNGYDGPFVDEKICDVNWTTTQEHVVKLVTVYPGTIMWDRLTFKPKI
ncbi:MAG: fasciclin domain-containing protein [Prolixibacteraceae bacterium]|jgi:uncharacterized surface protein with fasciclin (FAS1) repeats|nr:fasciclin domain-containing protein [Prolixibacteraceae bacterium]